MSQLSPLPSTKLELGTSLDDRLEALNGVDRKVEDIMDSIRQIMESLVKETKPISRAKMEESMRRFGRMLEDDISKVIQEQLNYMEQLCVGSEHQGSTFALRNRRDTFRQTLGNLHRELEILVPSKQEDEEEDGRPSFDDQSSPHDQEMASGSET